MRLVRPTVLRAALMTLTAIGLSTAPAAAALAHNGTGGSSSDYRIQVTGYEGDHSGFVLHVVELGNRLQLQRTSASSVMILGYEGEPYIRLDSRGIYENVNSPAHYLNLDRFASQNPPASASATATPSWHELSSGTTVVWHDHRAHWMSTTPRADVLADPGVERVIFPANRIDLLVDGHAVTAIIRVTWLPPPMQYVWLGVGSVLGLGVAAVFVMIPSTERFLGVVAVAGAVAALLGQGGSPTRHILGAVVILGAVIGLVVKRPLVGVGAAVGGLALSATRIEVFEHELLAGWLTPIVQRITTTVAIALCLGVVASALVGALGPTTLPTAATTGPLPDPSNGDAP